MPLIGRQTDERETDRQTDKHAGIQKRRQRKSTRLKSGGNLTPIHRSYRPWTVTTIISPPILPPIPPLIDTPLLPLVPSILLFIHPSFCSSFLSSVYLIFLVLISPSLDQSILPSIRTSFLPSIHPSSFPILSSLYQHLLLSTLDPGCRLCFHLCPSPFLPRLARLDVPIGKSESVIYSGLTQLVYRGPNNGSNCQEETSRHAMRQEEAMHAGTADAVTSKRS